MNTLTATLKLTTQKPLINDYVINVVTDEIGILVSIDRKVGAMVVRIAGSYMPVMWSPYETNFYYPAPLDVRKDWEV